MYRFVIEQTVLTHMCTIKWKFVYYKLLFCNHRRLAVEQRSREWLNVMLTLSKDFLAVG